VDKRWLKGLSTPRGLHWCTRWYSYSGICSWWSTSEIHWKVRHCITERAFHICTNWSARYHAWHKCYVDRDVFLHPPKGNPLCLMEDFVSSMVTYIELSYLVFKATITSRPSRVRDMFLSFIALCSQFTPKEKFNRVHLFVCNVAEWEIGVLKTKLQILL
jgi:hypothetical protein